jgi:hypothetical protein
MEHEQKGREDDCQQVTILRTFLYALATGHAADMLLDLSWDKTVNQQNTAIPCDIIPTHWKRMDHKGERQNTIL